MLPNYSNLKIQTLPNNFWDAFPKMTEIMPEALIYQGISVVKIPSRITKIHDSAFTSGSLKKVEFESNSQLTHIFDYAFRNCKFSTIEIPKKIKFIGENSFPDWIKRILVRNFTLERMLEEQITAKVDQWTINTSKKRLSKSKKDVINFRNSFGWSKREGYVRVVFSENASFENPHSWVGDGVWHTPQKLNGMIQWKLGLDEKFLDKNWRPRD